MRKCCCCFNFKTLFIPVLVLFSFNSLGAPAVLCREILLSEQLSLHSILSSKTFFYGTIAAGNLLPWIAMAGGFSGSGGGGGVASFQNPTQANLARAYLKEGRALPGDLLSYAKVRTLERWEMERNGVKLFLMDKDADWRVILAQAKSNLRMVSPIIARRMEQLSEWMEFGNWKTTEFLPIVNDAKPNQPLAENDVPIQFAVRFSLGNNSASQGPSRSKIRIKIIFNQKLFNLLDPVDQAILVFHEQLYALGQAVGLANSDEVRPLVNLFFSSYFEELRPRSQNGVIPAGLIPFFKAKLTKYFGDYAIFFSDLDVPKRGLPYSADRHFAVFVEVIKDLHKFMSECRKLGFSKDICADKSMLRISMHPDLSEEKAFVFMAYLFLEKTLNAINSESIMDAQLSSIDYKKAFEFACVTLKAQASQIEPSILAIQAALRYCR